MKKRLLSVARSVPGAVLAVALVLGAVSLSSARPSAAIAEGGPALSGYAWSDNIGWISFQSTDQPVRIDETGALSGYAWSDNIGWVKFGGLSAFPNASLGGNATLEDGLRLKGWARACAGTRAGDCSSMASRTDGWDGWISLAGPGGSGRYGVTLSDREFSGFAWGSDVVGWVDWSGVFAESEIGACFGPNGEMILNGKSRTYYSTPDVDGVCARETRTCTDGVLSSGAYTALRCGNPPLECERAGIRLAEGESYSFFSERLVTGSTAACSGYTDLHECCENLDEVLTCASGALVDALGAPDSEHQFLRCTPAPKPEEF
jgi:hypothetical protein